VLLSTLAHRQDKYASLEDTYQLRLTALAVRSIPAAAATAAAAVWC